jgi:hypothetical protein
MATEVEEKQRKEKIGNVRINQIKIIAPSI